MPNINVRRSESEQGEPARRDQRSVAHRRDEPSFLARSDDFFTSNPFSLMRRMHDEMDRMFAEAFGGGLRDPRGTAQRAGGGMMSRWSPPIEVSEQEGQLVVCADLPGLGKDDVHVEVTDDALVISGERKQERDETRGGVRQTERSYGRFERVIPLPEGVKADDAKARFNAGVLEVRIPVDQQSSRSRRIQIDTGEGGAKGASSNERSTPREGAQQGRS